ncbi:MAG: hypothetical protein R3B70_31615 [Polyangiaceae bacterium]
MSPSKSSASLLLLAMVTAGTSVAAQPPPDPKPHDVRARAEALFAQASDEMDRGQFVTACPKLEQVRTLAPDAGGAPVALGECYEGLGKLASALARYEIARQIAVADGNGARAAQCAARIRALTPRVARVTLHTSPQLRKIPGVVLRLDGAVLADAQRDVPLPIDKGTHTLSVSAAGYESASLDLTIDRDGASQTVDLPVLEREKPSASPTAIPTSSDTTPGSAPPSARLPVGPLVLGGVGLAAAIAGGTLLGVAAGTPARMEETVPRDENGNSLCRRAPQPGELSACAEVRSIAVSGSTMGNAGLGLVIGGAALLAGAGVYWLVPSPKADSKISAVVPFAGQDGGGLLLRGSF